MNHQQKIVLESASNAELVFIPIRLSQRVITKGQLNMVILMAQTISGSVWSMVVVLNKILKQRRNVTLLLAITDILKLI
jgi:hypothetical protein